MAHISFNRTVPFSADDMLGLIADIRHYPEFVPNCTDMEVFGGAGGQPMQARMSVKLGPIAQKYTSDVTIDTQARSVRAVALDGPFSHLDSVWRLTPTETGCEIDFDIDFGFSNPLIGGIAEPLFAAKQEEVMDAFLAEAARRFEPVSA